ncbi:unnamed protein product [Polarella glacialis]|uniref:G-protein coupled receptors family 1 profile domain-containing protein n=1 Tax=Polarella glacialis TaxID=89957 RepID=A0A813JC63_POLGL|nr:unnamed protein product [Polarella glacialis]
MADAAFSMHTVVLVLAILGLWSSTMNVLVHSSVRNTFNKFKLIDVTDRPKSLEYGLGSDVLLALHLSLYLLIPLALLVILRLAIQRNDKQMMRGVRMLSTLCAALCSIDCVISIFTVAWVFKQTELASDVKCDYSPPWNKDCAESRSAFIEIASTAASAFLYEIFLRIVQLICYVVSALLARTADEGLRSGLVFTGRSVVPSRLQGVVLGLPIQGASFGKEVTEGAVEEGVVEVNTDSRPCP